MYLVMDFSCGFQEILEKDLKEEDWEGKGEERKREWEEEMMSQV